jgi:hypothetical protein
VVKGSQTEERKARLDFAQDKWGDAQTKTEVARAVAEEFGVSLRTGYDDAAVALERCGGSRKHMRNWWHAVLTKGTRTAVKKDDLAAVAKLCAQHRGIFRLDMDAIEMMSDTEQRALFVQSFEGGAGDFDDAELQRIATAALDELAKRGVET